MVARNLLRDGDFLRPRVDTGPFPNWFLVEPPLYSGLVALISKVTQAPLEPVGRLTSAVAIALAAWGLFGLVRKREGPTAAFVAVGLFALFPVQIRYGRAFQPDALMVGLTVAGLRVVDEGGRRRMWEGWGLLALGIAVKAVGGFIVWPAFFCFRRNEPIERKWPRLSAFAYIGTILIPAFLWYVHAAHLLSGQTASASASSENAANWLARLGDFASAPWSTILRDLTLRAFSPVGFLLLCGCLPGFRRLDPLWKTWLVATALAFVVLAGKLRHEYYWLMASPIVAAVGAIAWGRIKLWNAPAAGTTLVLFCVLSLVQARSTWSTPDEWKGLTVAGRELASATSPDDLIIAPEALLYASDRRGCRLECEIGGIRRALAEWQENSQAPTALGLVAFYRDSAGATFFADLNPSREDPPRTALHQALKRSPNAKVLADRPGGLLLIQFDRRKGRGR